MLLVKITIMDIQCKAALLQLMKLMFEESENDLNLIIHSFSSNEEETKKYQENHKINIIL